MNPSNIDYLKVFCASHSIPMVSDFKPDYRNLTDEQRLLVEIALQRQWLAVSSHDKAKHRKQWNDDVAELKSLEERLENLRRCNISQ